MTSPNVKMKKITVLNYKGGVGKTFVAVVLAELFMVEGYRVAVVDTDPQLNAVDFLRNMDGGRVFENIEVVAAPALAPDFRELIVRGYDLAIVDTPPNVAANASIKQTIAESDVFVVPFMLHRHALFAVERTFELLPVGWPILPVCSVPSVRSKDKEHLLEMIREQLGQRDGCIWPVTFLPIFSRVECNLAERRDFFYRLTEKEYQAFEALRVTVANALWGD